MAGRLSRGTDEENAAETVANSQPRLGDLPSAWRSRYLTRFVGRERELSELWAHFQEGARLVTLVGPPGVGKTRLATELLSRGAVGLPRSGEPDVGSTESRSFFCDLRAATDEAQIVAELGQALEARFDDRRSEREGSRGVGSVLRALGECILVFDNFEQLVDLGSQTLGTWLREAPRARFLVTSRRVLSLAGEQVFELGPLSLTGDETDVASDAAVLFVDRARAAEPSFFLEPTDPSVYAFVERLQGIPLALEIAAGYLRRMSVDALRRSLEANVVSLENPYRDIDPRHATLFTAIEGSWSLLTEAERSVLDQLTVFRSPFTSAAAEAVVAHPPSSTCPSAPDVLASLRDGSMIRRSPHEDPSDEARYDFFEAVREFLHVRRDREERRAGEPSETKAPSRIVSIHEDAVLARHAKYFLTWGEETARRVPSPEGRGALHALAAVREDLRQAAGWYVGQGNADAALRLGLVFHEAVHRFDPRAAAEVFLGALSLECPPSSEEDVLARRRAAALLARATACRLSGDYAGALRDLEEADGLFPNDLIHRAEVLSERGLLFMESDDAQAARMELSEALDLVTGRDVPHLEGRICSRLAFVLGEAFHDPAALDHYAAAALLFSACRDPHAELAARVYWCLDRIKFHGSEGLFGELDALRAKVRSFRDKRLEIETLFGMTWVACECGDLAEATGYAQEAHGIAARGGLAYEELCAVFNLAIVLDEAGNPREATYAYRQCEHLASFHRLVRVAGLARLQLSGLLARSGKLTEARMLHESGVLAARRTGAPQLIAVAELQRGHILLARSRERRRQGDLAAAETLQQKAASATVSVGIEADGRASEQGSVQFTTRSYYGRHCVRVLRRELARPVDGSATIHVWEDGSLVQRSGQRPWPMPESPPLRRILSELARQRLDAPNTPVSVNELVGVGWPGERVRPDAGRTRVHNAVARLRKAGLREVLLRRESGYLLDANLPLVVERQAADPSRRAAEEVPDRFEADPTKPSLG